ncbi:MAG: ABC transporter permease [Candidatus Korarchaeum sp.]|nr:ABC transporter permease [Candidatus Korarchaeum sp.]MDW8035599.1 ABC transporter permease [Candidatus Korarchaeum sp.]
MKLVRRVEASRKLIVGIRFLSIIIAFALASLLLLLHEVNPLDFYAGLVLNVFGTKVGVSESVVRMIPLLLISSGLALSFRAGFWNIGAEGQLLAGAMFGYLIAFNFGRSPSYIVIPLLFLAGYLAGAAWGVIPAILKAKLNVNDVLSTLMLYYVLYWVFQHMIHGPWKAVETVGGLTYGGFAHTKVLPENSQLPVLAGTRVHWPTLLIALASSILVYLLLRRTTWGFEIRAFGRNPDASRAAGISGTKVLLLVAFVSGGLSGIAGIGELCGIQKRFTPEFLSGYGFSAIITAWLSGNNPVNLITSNFLYGGLLVGGSYAMISYRLPIGFIDMFNGLILLSVLAGEFLIRYELRRD